MARYKLRVPEIGAFLYGSAETAVVAESIADARTIWFEEMGVVEPFWTCYRGSCRVVYARDIECGDCHGEAEPGDTTVDYLPHDPDEPLAAHEILCFEPGIACPARWEQQWRDPRYSRLPVGTKVEHPVFGRGVMGPGRMVDFRGLKVGHVHGMTVDWYGARERALVVDGEDLFSVAGEGAWNALQDLHMRARRYEAEAAAWPEFERWLSEHPEVLTDAEELSHAQ